MSRSCNASRPSPHGANRRISTPHGPNEYPPLIRCRRHGNVPRHRKPSPETVVIQMGIDVLLPFVCVSQLILARPHLQQGDPHAIEDTSHHIFMTATRLDHHLRLHTGKITDVSHTRSPFFRAAVAVRYVKPAWNKIPLTQRKFPISAHPDR